MTIGEAKLEIAHISGIPPEQLHLYARHHLLLQKDDSTLSELDIQEGATLLVRQGAFMDLELASTALGGRDKKDIQNAFYQASSGQIRR